MPRIHDAESKKELILQAALRCFSRKGFHAATTKEIAAEAGAAEGLIFYYYGGKQELLQQVVRRFSFMESAREKFAGLQELEPMEALVQFGLMYMSFLDANKDYLLLIWSADMMRNEYVSREVYELIQGIGEQGRLHLGRLCGGRLPNLRAAEVAVNMLFSSLLTYVLVGSRAESRHSEEDEGYVRSVISILLNGFLSRK